ncbi:hypothetical protein FRB90_000593 [Tulasnella sp. 427]|nr:hypothetical protein FRB90_000593 [Tulasnella sp. 427]
MPLRKENGVSGLEAKFGTLNPTDSLAKNSLVRPSRTRNKTSDQQEQRTPPPTAGLDPGLYQTLHFHLPQTCIVNRSTGTVSFRRPRNSKDSDVIEINKHFVKGYNLVRSELGASESSDLWRKWGILGLGYFKLALKARYRGKDMAFLFFHGEGFVPRMSSEDAKESLLRELEALTLGSRLFLPEYLRALTSHGVAMKIKISFNSCNAFLGQLQNAPLILAKKIDVQHPDGYPDNRSEALLEPEGWFLATEILPFKEEFPTILKFTSVDGDGDTPEGATDRDIVAECFLQAFAHFVFKFSHRNKLLVDLQGFPASVPSNHDTKGPPIADKSKTLPREAHHSDGLPQAQPTLSRVEFEAVRKKLTTAQTSLSNLEKVFGALTSVDFIFQSTPNLASSLNNTPDLELAREHGHNKLPLLFEAEMELVAGSLDEAQSVDMRLEEARNALLLILQDVKKDWTNLKLDRWQRRLRAFIQRQSSVAPTVDCDKLYTASAKTYHPTHLSVCLTVIIASVLFNASRSLCQLILAASAITLQDVKDTHGHTIPPPPKTLDAALARFDLDPVLAYKVQCPECGALYSFSEGRFPEKCTHQEIPNGPICDSLLGVEVRMGGKIVCRARKLFVLQSFSAWIARLLARPGLEAAMDKCARESHPKDVASDIWEAKFIHGVEWKDGKKYAEAPPSDLRLVFTMAVDWFGAHHSGAAQKTWSVGAIYMTCLNLPAAIRHRPENICLVGIIPGPRKPSMKQVNHLLKPIMEELVPFWETGKWYSRTTEFPEGRLVWVLLLLLIADLDACRALAGLNSHTDMKFCSYCTITLDTIDNIDTDSFILRDPTIHRQQALKWLEAQTDVDRNTITKDFDVRYSEFFRLPYWSPITQVPPESAHLFWLGLFKRHCRRVWKMDMTVEGGDGTALTMRDPPSSAEMTHARLVFKTGKSATGKSTPLQKLYMSALYALCLESGAVRDIRGRHNVKCHLVEALEATKTRQDLRNAIQAPKPPAVDQNLFAPPSQTIDRDSITAATQETSSPCPALESKHRDKWHTSFKKQDLFNLARGFWRPGDPFIDEKWTRLQISDWLKNRFPTVGLAPTSSSGRAPPPDTNVTVAVLEEYKNIILKKQPHNWCSVRKSILFVVCKALQTARDIEPEWSWTTTALASFLQGRLLSGPERVVQTKSLRGRGISAHGQRTVLGLRMLDAIREDRNATILPTGYQKAPEHMGSKGHGKLSADEYRTAVLIHMVISLPRLWKLETSEVRYHKMLDHFLHLAVAVSLATSHEMDEDRITKYQAHMKEYLGELRNLFPTETLVQSHHLALHMPYFLNMLGPVPPWNALGPERYNGMLQKIPTNNRFGYMEKTMMLSFCRSANLRALFSDRTLPSTLHQFYPIMDAKIRGLYRGTLERDYVALGKGAWVACIVDKAQTNSLRIEERTCLESYDHDRWKWGQDITSITGRGRKYVPNLTSQDLSAAPVHTRDSTLVFRSPSGRVAAGRIERIMTLEQPHDKEFLIQDKASVILLVRELLPLTETDASLDPYLNWPDLHCKLYYNAFKTSLTCISSQDILGPVALCPLRTTSEEFSRQCLIVRYLE